MKHLHNVNTAKIAENINRLRLEKRLSTYDLARQAGVPYTTLRNIEYDLSNFPSFAVIYRVAQTLDVTMEYLNGDEIEISSENRIFFRAYLMADPDTKTTIKQMLSIIDRD